SLGFVWLLSTRSTSAAFIACLIVTVLSSWAWARFISTSPKQVSGLVTGALASTFIASAFAFALETAFGYHLLGLGNPLISSDPILRYWLMMATIGVSCLGVLWTEKEHKESYLVAMGMVAALGPPLILTHGGGLVAYVAAVVVTWILSELTGRKSLAALGLAAASAATIAHVLQTQVPHALASQLLIQLGVLVAVWTLQMRIIWRSIPDLREEGVTLTSTVIGLCLASASFVLYPWDTTGLLPAHLFPIAAISLVLTIAAWTTRIRPLTYPSIAFAAMAFATLIGLRAEPGVWFAAGILTLCAAVIPSPNPEWRGGATLPFWLRTVLGGFVCGTTGFLMFGPRSYRDDLALLGFTGYLLTVVLLHFLGAVKASHARKKNLGIVGVIAFVSPAAGLLISVSYTNHPFASLAMAAFTLYAGVLTYALYSVFEQSRQQVLGVGAFVSSLALIDTVYLASPRNLPETPLILCLTTGFIALGLSVASRRYKSVGLGVPALILGLALTSLLTLSLNSAGMSAGRYLACLGLTFIGLVFPVTTTSNKNDAILNWTLRIGAGWACFTRLVVVALGLLGVQWSHDPTVSLGWTLYGAGLLVAGFRLHSSPVRLTGVILLLFTVVKVVVVNLVATDPAIKVLVLTALGVTMLVVGHFYVRRGALNKATETPLG
ncbi:MAG: DUF2339 domain-containing protein, partial [bacterium]